MLKSVLSFLFGPSGENPSSADTREPNLNSRADGSANPPPLVGDRTFHRAPQQHWRAPRGAKAPGTRTPNSRGYGTSARTRGRVRRTLMAPPGSFPGLSQPAEDPYLDEGHENDRGIADVFVSQEREVYGDDESAKYYDAEVDNFYGEEEDFDDESSGRASGSTGSRRPVFAQHRHGRHAPMSIPTSRSVGLGGAKIHPNQQALKQQEQQQPLKVSSSQFPQLQSPFSITSPESIAGLAVNGSFSSSSPQQQRVAPVYRDTVSEEALRALNNRTRKSPYGVRGGGIFKTETVRPRILSPASISRKRGFVEQEYEDYNLDESEDVHLSDHLDEFELRRRRNLANGLNHHSSSVVKRRKHQLVHFQDEVEVSEHPHDGRGLIGQPAFSSPSGLQRRGGLKRSVRRPRSPSSRHQLSAKAEENEEEFDIEVQDDEFYEEDEIDEEPLKRPRSTKLLPYGTEQRRAAIIRRSIGTPELGDRTLRNPVLDRSSSATRYQATGKRKQIGVTEDDYLPDEGNVFDAAKNLSPEDGWITPASYRLKRARLSTSRFASPSGEAVQVDTIQATDGVVASPAKIVKRADQLAEPSTAKNEQIVSLAHADQGALSPASATQVNPQRSISSVTTSRGRVKLSSASTNSSTAASPLLTSATPVKDRHLAITKMPTPVLHKPLNDDDVDRFIDQNILKAEEKAGTGSMVANGKDKSVTFNLPEEGKFHSNEKLGGGKSVSFGPPSSSAGFGIAKDGGITKPHVEDGQSKDEANTLGKTSSATSALPFSGLAPSGSGEPGLDLPKADIPQPKSEFSVGMLAGSSAIPSQDLATTSSIGSNEQEKGSLSHFPSSVNGAFSFGSQPGASASSTAAATSGGASAASPVTAEKKPTENSSALPAPVAPQSSATPFSGFGLLAEKKTVEPVPTAVAPQSTAPATSSFQFGGFGSTPLAPVSAQPAAAAVSFGSAINGTSKAAADASAPSVSQPPATGGFQFLGAATANANSAPLSAGFQLGASDKVGATPSSVASKDLAASGGFSFGSGTSNTPVPTFGAAPATSTTSAPPPFGFGATAESKPAFSFGTGSVAASESDKSKPEVATTGGFIFGSTQAAAAGPAAPAAFSFGQPQSSTNSSAPASNNFSFGQAHASVSSNEASALPFSFGASASAAATSPAAMSFGAPPQTQPLQQAQASGFSFGQQQQQPTSFGQPQAGSVAVGGNGSTLAGGLSFGQTPSASQAPAFGGFGTASSGPPPAFGQQPQQQSGSGFFGSSAPAFGQPKPPQQQQPTFSFGSSASSNAGTDGFGQNQQQTPFGSQSVPSASLTQPAFGSSQSQQNQFGMSGAPTFSFGGQQQQQPNSNQPQQQGGAFTFGSGGGGSSSFGAPAAGGGANGGGFSFGQPQMQQQQPQPQSQPMFSFGAGGGAGAPHGSNTGFSFGQTGNAGFGSGQPSAPASAQPFSFGAGASSSAAPGASGTFLFGGGGTGAPAVPGGLFNPGSIQMERKLAQPKQRGLRRR